MQQNKLLQEAVNIGNRIIEQFEIERTFEILETISAGKSEDLDICSGLSGTLLFFTNLFSITKSHTYKTFLTKYGKILIEKYKTLKYMDNSLMYGKAGIAYTFLQIYHVTEDEIFLEKSLEIIKNPSNNFSNPISADFSFYKGNAGILWTIFQFYLAKPESWISYLLGRYINSFIKNIILLDEGFAWKTGKNNIKPLCGYAYGNSGIAYVFLEMGNFFKNETYQFIANQALLYETFQWDDKNKRWPDYRKELNNHSDYKAHISNFYSRNPDFFLTPENNTTYEHGNAGVLITHLYAQTFTGKSEKKNVIQNSINQLLTRIDSVKDENIDFSISNGFLGEMLALNYANKYEKDIVQEKLDILLNIIIDKSKGELNSPIVNHSLLNGLAGLGYFYLIIAGEKEPEMVFLPGAGFKPNLNKVESFKEISNISINDLWIEILKTNYPRLYYILNNFFSENQDDFIVYHQSVISKSIPDSFLEFHQKVLAINNEKKIEIIEDLVDLEKAKLVLASKNKSNALLHISEVIKERNIHYLTNLNSNDLNNCSLIVDKEYMEFVTTRWNWIENFDKLFSGISQLEDIYSKTDEFEVSFLLQSNSIKEIYLSNTNYYFISLFYDGKLVTDAINEFIDAFEAKTNDEISKVTQFANQLVIKYIIESVLIINNNRIKSY